MASSKVSVSPSFKGNITNIMRQRQLFLDATRASASESNSNDGILTKLWKRVSILVPGRKGVSVGVGVAIGLAISTQIPASSSALRCIPQGLYSHSSSSSSSYAWNAIGREALDKIIAVNSLVLMGLTSTVISAVILSAFRPFGSLRCCRTTTTESAESGSESGSGSGSGSGSVSDTTFDALFYEEYDTMMSASACTSDSASASSGEPASFSAVPVTTPRCELVITYVPARSAFGYYTDRKDSIPYSHLETAARMFLVKNARPDLAKLAYVDRRPSTNHSSAVPSTAVPSSAVPSAGVPDDIVSTPSTSSGGIFAMFKSYNRKPAAAASSDSTTTTTTTSNSGAAATAAPATDTHFVYMGTMQDYKATRDKSKRSPTSRSSGSGEETPYVNVKYTEFKSRSKL
jgi:hypothetical protein